jgi:SnoaL-like domain
MERTHVDTQVLLHSFYDALDLVMHGDATAMLALWSERNDVTYCDPHGHFYSGREALVDYWQQAVLRNRQSPATVSATAEVLMTQASSEMVCMVVGEHIQIKEQDRVTRLYAISTNIYRYGEQKWCMLHRHSGVTNVEE